MLQLLLFEHFQRMSLKNVKMKIIQCMILLSLKFKIAEFKQPFDFLKKGE